MAYSNLVDLRSKKLWVAGLAEFFAVFFLVIVGCGSCLSPEHSNVVRISFAFALSIATLVWATAHVSGGHLNPAVTLAFLLARRITVVRAVLYTIAQMAGAVVGAGILRLVSPNPQTLGTSAPPANGSVDVGQVLGIELLITFVLVWTVFSTVDGARSDLSGSGPLAIGLSIGMCHLWAVPLTGAGMNPARVFGPALIAKSWKFHWAYWVGPLIGGGVAGLLYEFVFAVNATPAKLRGFFSREYDDTNYDKYGEKSEIGEDTELNKKDYGSTAP